MEAYISNETITTRNKFSWMISKYIDEIAAYKQSNGGIEEACYFGNDYNILQMVFVPFHPKGAMEKTQFQVTME